MAAGTLIPLEEYLSQSFEPDREYVDGTLVERNVGEYFHSLLQALITHALIELRSRSGIRFSTLTEQRVRVREGPDRERRYRIPDVMAPAPGHRRTGITLDPPMMTVEIVSPDDKIEELFSKSHEYLRFGVPHAIVAIHTAGACFASP